MSNRKTPLNKGFRPHASYHEPVVRLEAGTVLTPHRDAEEQQEKAIAANPVLDGYVKRYAKGTGKQPRVRYEGYSAGWQDCWAFIAPTLTQRQNIVPFKSASPIVGGRY